MQIDNQQMLPVGTLLKGGEYRVERYIASGGFGNTYEVEHVRLGKRMALKEFFMRGINQREGTRVSVSQEDNRESFDQMREKFYKEAQRLARLEEEHIVEVNDFFEENQTAYYTMKLIDGQSLSAQMKKSGRPFTEQQISKILPQLLDALRYVHSNALYHLDLKPGNIMQNVNGHCWLIDFGASKQLSPTESQTLSTSTGLCYTPGFAPSEQITGSTKRIGAWTDYYALGATLYNLLTGKTPPSPDDIMNDEDAAFAFPASVSSRMRKLVIWMMQPRPANRPQNVEQIEKFLETGNEETVGRQSKPHAQQSSYNMDDGTSTVLSGSTSQQTRKQETKNDYQSNTSVQDSEPSLGCLGLVGVVFSFYPVFGFVSYFLMRNTYPQKAKMCMWISVFSTAICFLVALINK